LLKNDDINQEDNLKSNEKVLTPKFNVLEKVAKFIIVVLGIGLYSNLI